MYVLSHHTLTAAKIHLLAVSHVEQFLYHDCNYIWIEHTSHSTAEANMGASQPTILGSVWGL